MRRTNLRLAVGVALTCGVAAPAVALAATQRTDHRHASAAPAAAVRLSSVSVKGDDVAIKGSVKLSPNTAATRANTRVVIKLAGDGNYDRDVIALTRSDTFSRTFKTALTGKLTVSVRVLEGVSRYVGQTVTRAVTVATPSAKVVTVTEPSSSTAITTTTGTANQVPLVGVFKLGSGSEFVMENLETGLPVTIGSATLTAGSDGGLSSFEYQPGPSPAFSGGSSGGALANRIIQPVGFDGTNFSVDTQPTDLQDTSDKDPVPQIYVSATGQLSGQVTAWDAQWNGQSFNQGTPKPNGTTPKPTTALSGTYDWSTGAYTLTWKSLIVGGPFNNFTGVWTLKGTFVPAKFS